MQRLLQTESKETGKLQRIPKGVHETLLPHQPRLQSKKEI